MKDTERNIHRQITVDFYHSWHCILTGIIEGRERRLGPCHGGNDAGPTPVK